LKSLMLLWHKVLHELGDLSCVSTAKDYEYVLSRVRDEGDSFLTITLPSFGEGLEKALSLGEASPGLFPAFKKGRGCLPAFLQGFSGLIFDPVSGRLLDSPSIDAIFAIRQLSGMFKKILLPCSEEREVKAIERYIECERGIRESDSSFSPELRQRFRRMSNLLFREIFTDMDRKVYADEVLPKHGPGKTADGLLGNKKFLQTVWTERLEPYFPFGWYGLPVAPGAYREYRSSSVRYLDPGAELPVKVVTVPKTLKTPRIIAIEPTCMQYTQQALLEQLVELIESSHVLNGMIGFRDQTINNRLARLGSLTGSYATLDLKEASDRVSNQHVLEMLANFPWFSGAVQACRSRKADVPGHGVIRLAKFASMGSALCFPFEAMIFLTIIFLSFEKSANRQFTRSDIRRFSRHVRVFGDDIIVPTDMAPSVIEELDTFGYLVNHDKSFWTGMFRESCGKEYFLGEDVSIVKVRRVFPSSRHDVLEIVSLVSLRNRFYEHGLWRTARWLDEFIEESPFIRAYPTIDPSSSALGRHSLLFHYLERDKWYEVDPDTHGPLVRAHVVSAKSPSDKLDGLGAQLKWFLKRGDEPFADKDHLERYGRPDAVSLKLRKVSPL
jgi:hypothetical protein